MTATRERNETFEVEDHYLVRNVVPVRGKPYGHRCPKTSLERVAHAIDELGNEAFTLESLLEYERNADRDVTFTNVAVALAFLKERGIVKTRYRRNYAATKCAHLDAMTEYYALAENA